MQLPLKKFPYLFFISLQPQQSNKTEILIVTRAIRICGSASQFFLIILQHTKKAVRRFKRTALISVFAQDRIFFIF